MTAKSRHLRRELTALLLLATCASAQAAENEIKSGAVVELRYRHETVDDDAFTRTAQADTLRLRLGYLWAFAPSWQAYADAERVQTLFGDDFNSTANGETGYPTVADPQGTEMPDPATCHAWAPSRLAGQPALFRQLGLATE